MTPIVLGRYRLDQQVGQGGMAVVWRGFDTQLRRTVAVKVLHPHLHSRAEIRRRFDREAHAVARLHHPHILDIFDFSGPEAEPSYLVTEFIPGTSLRAFAEAHPFDPPELAAACALSLVEALEHAHAANVVHRDVKPENVMVRDDGVMKLTDFGLAALLDPDEKFTSTGAILGSPSHLAPETIEGKAADPRSDLFSLGTVLYWLACGQLPFQAKTPAALLQQILEGKPSDPRAARPSVSDGLALLISQLLERNPEKRIQTASQARVRLTALLADAGIDDPAAELAAFVRGNPPEEVANALRTRLVAQSLSRGEEAMSSRRTAAAIGSFTRALALDPQNEEAAKKLAQIRNRARTIRRVKAAAVALSMAALALFFVVQHRLHPRPKPAPLAAAEAQPQSSDQRKLRQAIANLIAPTESSPKISSAQQPAPQPAIAIDSANPPGPTVREPAPSAAASTNGLHTNQSAHPAGEGETSPHAALALAGRRLSRVQDPGLGNRGERLDSAETVQATLNVHWVWARVFLDGIDLGENKVFNRRLSLGPHKVTVIHACCLDGTQTIDVEPGETRYTLEPGKPKAARIALVGAPPDAQVLIDGVAMGVTQALADHELAMTDQPTRDVLVTVGDRSSHVMLQAGRTIPIDYLQLKQGIGP